MQNQMPQEIEVWFIIPALRRELAKSMIKDYHCTQKQVSQKMGLTEAAVSQYLHSKRGSEVMFSNAILEEVKKTAKKIVEEPNYLISEMMKLTKMADIKQVMCDLHKKQDISLPSECNCCFEDELLEVKK